MGNFSPANPVPYALSTIKSKFHENKDWNIASGVLQKLANSHQEQVPRKQGLKHQPTGGSKGAPVASRASSTKTRIETLLRPVYLFPPSCIKSKFHENKDWNLILYFSAMPLNMHQEQVPRKQGLKPGDDTTLSWSKGLHQEQVPRKQGLKPRGVQGIGLKPEASRASSTKTRIETPVCTEFPVVKSYHQEQVVTPLCVDTFRNH